MERGQFTREFKLEAVRLIKELDRGFQASSPNRKWIADFTYVYDRDRTELAHGARVA